MLSAAAAATSPFSSFSFVQNCLANFVCFVGGQWSKLGSAGSDGTFIWRREEIEMLTRQPAPAGSNARAHERARTTHENSQTAAAQPTKSATLACHMH